MAIPADPRLTRPFFTVGDAWQAKLAPFVGAERTGVANPFASTAVGAASPVTPASIPPGVTNTVGPARPMGSLFTGPAGPALPQQPLPPRGIPSTLYTTTPTAAARAPITNPFAAMNAPTARGTLGVLSPQSVRGGTLRATGRNILGRGLGGLALYEGLNLAGDVAGDNTAGDSLRAAALPSAAAFLATGSAAPAAAVGGGVALGTAAASLIPGNEDNNWSNVARNLGLTERSDLGAYMADLEAAGIPVGGLIQVIQESGDPQFARQWLATELGRAGVEGASIEDGEVSIDGKALDIVEAFDEALTGGGDPLGQLVVGLAQEGASEEEVLAAVGAYSETLAAQGDQQDPAMAAAAARQFVDDTNAAAQAEQDWFDQAMAYQAQVAQYLAPITGQMRQQADASFEAQRALIAGLGLPPQVEAGMLMQADADRRTQLATANAYDAQMALLPQQTAVQDFQALQQGIANQLLQGAIQQQITGLTNPLGMDPSSILSGIAG